MDKLRAMTFFCRVAEHKSFAAAAQSLQVVPSALSKAIAALEHDLGFRLVNRSTRGLVLTEEGAAYHERCRQILHDIEDADGLGRGGLAQPRGTLRLGMHPALRFALLSTLGSLLDRYPDLNVETVITNSPSAVIDAGLDVVFHIGRLADSSLVARQIATTRLLLCASPGYLATRGTPLHPSELARHRALVPGRRDEEADPCWRFRRGDETCAVDVCVRMMLRDGIGLVDAALGGCGIARPLDISVRPWLASGQLVEVLPDWSAERQAISAVMPANVGRSSAKVRACVEHVSAILHTKRV